MKTQRLLPNVGNLSVVLGFVVLICAGWPALGEDWDKCPAIVVDGVTQDPGQDWINVSQTYFLSIEGIDEDSESGVPDGGDHLYSATTIWDGEWLDSEYGLENTWIPQHWTEGKEISVTVDDNPTTPDGTNTDDSSVDGPTFTLKAWEFKITMTVTCTADPNQSASKVITQTGYGTSVETSASTECTLAKGPVQAKTWNTGCCVEPTCDTADDGPIQFVAAQADAKWKIATLPAQNVETYSATVKADVDASMSGSLMAETEDTDWDGNANVVVEVLAKAAGAPSWAVDVVTNLKDWDSEAESAAGIGFGFNSDVLGSCLDNVYKIEIGSSHEPNDKTKTFSHDPDSAHLMGDVSDEKYAQAKIDGKVEARGYQYICPLLHICTHEHSEASIESTGSCTFECSNVTAENLQENESRLIE